MKTPHACRPVNTNPRSTGRSRIIGAVLLLMALGAAGAATPPALLNYQGVLRAAAGAPLDGSYDMTFRFWSAEVGGDEILVDSHLLANGQAVVVTGGLFTAALGGGLVTDGSGPSTYTSLVDVFRVHDTVWLEVQVGAEILSPRIRVVSAAYALNAARLDGRAAGEFLDTSTVAQTKNGALIVSTVFSSALAAHNVTLGGASDVCLACGVDGIEASGTGRAGRFWNLAASGNAVLGEGDLGISAAGNQAGGYFQDLDSSGYAFVGIDHYGIQGFGNAAGGYFNDSDHSGYAYVGFGDRGIEAQGTNMGGFFRDTDDLGYAYLGYLQYGIQGYGGAAGGYFSDTNGTGYAFVATGDRGITAFGSEMGGSFHDTNGTGLANLATGDRGIWGKGTFAGGTFSHPDNVTHWADVSLISSGTTYKIRGTGTVSFVQNHPWETDKVVVYAAPEGDEVAVYTRGTARLHGGEAVVGLGESFALVANPDVGLTAHLTPRGEEPVPLAVERLSTEELIVRGPAGSDAAFDYLVYGLRIGFERHAAVQPKDSAREAFIPEAEAHDTFFAAHPQLEASSALERFTQMRAVIGETAPIDLSGSRSLAAAINRDRARIVAEAAVSELPRGPGTPETEGSLEEASTLREREASRPAAPSAPEAESTAPAGVAGAPSGGSIRMHVAEPVEAGDLLVLDPGAAGLVRRAAEVADPGVIAIAAAPSEILDGRHWVVVAETLYATVRADAGYGEIRPGDLLVSSPTPGHAMRAFEIVPGTVIGKAIDPLEAGTGEIRVLVMPR